jgi:hypothetical protein
MKLDQNLLDAQWLKKAKESSWLQSCLNDYQVSEDVLAADDERDFQGLLAEKDYPTAAHALITQCARQWDESGPFAIAMAEDNVELVIALLAQTDLTAYGFENNLLAMAVAYNRRAIFNLLLLHPDIDTQCSYEVDREAREVAEFCGIYDWCDHCCPHMWLMETQYAALYQFMDIDWQYRINGDAPLLVHLYRQGEFDAMSRLVAAGAEINPAIDERDQRVRLIHLALEDWRDDKPKTQQGVKWFARYVSFLNDPSFDLDVLTDLLRLDTPQIAELFKLDTISYIEAEVSEKDEVLSAVKPPHSELENALYSPLAYQPRHQKHPSSLADDLLRLRLVEFVPGIVDLQFTISEAGIEFGLFFQGRSFSQSILLPTKILDLLDFKAPLPIQAMTPFQCQAWLLSCPSELYLWLNILCEDAGTRVFSSVKGHPISAIKRQLGLSEILATGGIEGEYFLIDLLQRGLDRFESILRLLSEERLLKTPFLAEQHHDLKAYRAQDAHKRPKLALAVSERSDSIQVVVHAMIEEKWCDLGARPIDDDWAMMLFESPNFIPCQQCAETFYRHNLAYDEECMECINAPG